MLPRSGDKSVLVLLNRGRKFGSMRGDGRAGGRSAVNRAGSGRGREGGEGGGEGREGASDVNLASCRFSKVVIKWEEQSEKSEERTEEVLDGARAVLEREHAEQVEEGCAIAAVCIAIERQLDLYGAVKKEGGAQLSKREVMPTSRARASCKRLTLVGAVPGPCCRCSGVSLFQKRKEKARLTKKRQFLPTMRSMSYPVRAANPSEARTCDREQGVSERSKGTVGATYNGVVAQTRVAPVSKRGQLGDR
jgi:hypothetical protein